jgi:hypothetical protein
MKFPKNELTVYESQITCLEHSSKMRDQFGEPMKTASFQFGKPMKTASFVGHSVWGVGGQSQWSHGGTCAEGQRVEVVHHLTPTGTALSVSLTRNSARY